VTSSWQAQFCATELTKKRSGKMEYFKKNYIINQNFMNMVGVLDRNAKPCTLITEVGRKFIVDKSPLEIIKDSIKCIGFCFDIRESTQATKWILGDIHMCPVMINPIHRICVFPNKAPKNEDTMWFNPLHIIRTGTSKGWTTVEFTNGLILEVPCRLTAFNNKWKAADELRDITVEIASNPISILFEPRRKRLQFIARKKIKQHSKLGE
jgi:competence protein ComK